MLSENKKYSQIYSYSITHEKIIPIIQQDESEKCSNLVVPEHHYTNLGNNTGAGWSAGMYRLTEVMISAQPRSKVIYNINYNTEQIWSS